MISYENFHHVIYDTIYYLVSQSNQSITDFFCAAISHFTQLRKLSAKRPKKGAFALPAVSGDLNPLQRPERSPPRQELAKQHRIIKIEKQSSQLITGRNAEGAYI